ncbi:MAG: cytochrome P450 [Tumebacillaceae bacterium]
MNTTRKYVGLMVPPLGFTEAANPWDWYDVMRQTSPVAFDPARNCWDVFSYDDVQRTLSDHKYFSSKRIGEDRRVSLISIDPPKHMRYRQLVNQAFTPKTVEGMAPRIAEITRELLDEIEARGTGEFDLIEDFSYPLPVIVIAEMLGVPNEDRAKFKHWSDIIVAGIAGQSREELMKLIALKDEATAEMDAYFTEIIAQRRTQTDKGNDLITALLEAQLDEQHLSLPELLSFCFLLLVAGNETTTNLIGNTVLTLTEHPEALAQLQANPDLIPAAIEEGLRFRSPVQSINRITVEDVELGGQVIPAGSEVLAWIGSANRDEAKFERAHEFLIDRSPNQHMAFGHGVHFCLGAPLARLEGKIALTELIRRLPNLRRVDQSPLTVITSPLVYGYKSLPLKF